MEKRKILVIIAIVAVLSLIMVELIVFQVKERVGNDQSTLLTTGELRSRN